MRKITNQTTAIQLGELAVTAGLWLFLVGCGGGSRMESPQRHLIAVSVQPTSAEAIVPDGSVQFSATGTFDHDPIAQPNLPVAWNSSDSNIASIDSPTGVATCLTVGGPVTVTGSATDEAGTVRGTGTLTCQNSPNPVVKLDPASLGVWCRFHGVGVPVCGCLWGVNGNNVTVTNIGGSTLPIDSILTGTKGSQGFSQTNTCSASLDPGQSCNITVTFKPPSTGNFHDDVVITDGATDGQQTAGLGARVDCVP